MPDIPERIEGIERQDDTASSWSNYPPEIVEVLLELRDRFAEIYDPRTEDISEKQEEIEQDIERELQKLDAQDQVEIFVDGVQVSITYSHWKWHQRKYICSIWGEEYSVEVGGSMKRMILELIMFRDKFCHHVTWKKYYNARDLRDKRCSLSRFFEYQRGLWIRFNPSLWHDTDNHVSDQADVQEYIKGEKVSLWLTHKEDEIVTLSEWKIVARMSVSIARPGLMQSIKEKTLRPNPWVNQELEKLGVRLVRQQEWNLVLERIES